MTRIVPIAAALLLLAACSTPEEVEKQQEEHQATIEDDVTVTACDTDEAGYMRATLNITNNSDDPSTYSVDIAFESPDGKTQLATGSAFVDELQNGQSTTTEANSLKEAAGEFKCRVADVTRFAS